MHPHLAAAQLPQKAAGTFENAAWVQVIHGTDDWAYELGRMMNLRPSSGPEERDPQGGHHRRVPVGRFNCVPGARVFSSVFRARCLVRRLGQESGISGTGGLERSWDTTCCQHVPWGPCKPIKARINACKPVKTCESVIMMALLTTLWLPILGGSIGGHIRGLVNVGTEDTREAGTDGGRATLQRSVQGGWGGRYRRCCSNLHASRRGPEGDLKPRDQGGSRRKAQGRSDGPRMVG